MSLLTILLILLIVFAVTGSFYRTPGATAGTYDYPYRTGGLGIGGLLVVVLILILLLR